MSFHTKSGIYFESGPDGSVIITIKADHAENAATIKDVTLTADEWASVVGFLSPQVSVAAPEPKPKPKPEREKEAEQPSRRGQRKR